MIDKIPEIKYRDISKSKNIDDTHNRFVKLYVKYHRN